MSHNGLPTEREPTIVNEGGPWSRKDSNHLTSAIVVVVAVGAVVAFLFWLNHFLDGIGF